MVKVKVKVKAKAEAKEQIDRGEEHRKREEEKRKTTAGTMKMQYSTKASRLRGGEPTAVPCGGACGSEQCLAHSGLSPTPQTLFRRYRVRCC